jgi:hypothetical protein
VSPEQTTGDEIPAVQEYPTGQIMHVLILFAISCEEYVPSGQVTGSVIPEFEQKDPTGHCWQKDIESAPAVAENVPAGHNISEVDPILQKVPGLHSVQLPALVWLLLAE